VNAWRRSCARSIDGSAGVAPEARDPTIDRCAIDRVVARSPPCPIVVSAHLTNYAE